MARFIERFDEEARRAVLAVITAHIRAIHYTPKVKPYHPADL